MTDLFTSLFKLKLKRSGDPIEDYLTEIFVFILSNKPEVFQDFMALINVEHNIEDDYVVSSQFTFNKIENHQSDSRPDVLVTTGNTEILIENKVESLEGNNQLRRYAEHLNMSDVPNKILLYITKNYDNKSHEYVVGNNPSKLNIRFVQLRWYQVYKVLSKYSSDLIINQILNFMNEQDLSMNRQFKPEDLIAMSHFGRIHKIMKETLFGKVSKKFKSVCGGLTQESSSMTQLRNHDRYILSTDLKHKAWAGLGFWMNGFNDKNYPELRVIIELQLTSDKRKEIVDALLKESNLRDNWYSYNIENGNKVGWGGIATRKSLQFFLNEEDQVKAIQEYFVSVLDELNQILTKNQELLK